MNTGKFSISYQYSKLTTVRQMAAKLNLLVGHPIKGIEASIPKNIDNHNQYGGRPDQC